jgi:thiol-disulfide isomerase/thioredoxin
VFSVKKILFILITLIFTVVSMSGCFRFPGNWSQNVDDWIEDDEWDDDNWDDDEVWISEGGYQAGYDAGWNDGYADAASGKGFEAGYVTDDEDFYQGYMQGYIDGYNNGEDGGTSGNDNDEVDYFEIGRSDGYDNGYYDALNGYDFEPEKDVGAQFYNNEEYAAGYTWGYNEGYDDGYYASDTGDTGGLPDDYRDIALYNAYTNEYFTLEEYRGQMVCVIFWGSWCPTCRGKMESFDELWLEANSYDFNIITAVMPEHYGEMTIGDFIDWFPTDTVEYMRVYFDEEAAFMTYFDINAVPAYFVFGSDGEILWIYDHIPSNDELLNDMITYTDAGY